MLTLSKPRNMYHNGNVRDILLNGTKWGSVFKHPHSPYKIVFDNGYGEYQWEAAKYANNLGEVKRILKQCF